MLYTPVSSLNMVLSINDANYENYKVIIIIILINWPLLTIESPVAQWLEHPTRSRRVVGSNPIWGSDFFRVLHTFNLSCVCCFIFK